MNLSVGEERVSIALEYKRYDSDLLFQILSSLPRRAGLFPRPFLFRGGKKVQVR